MRRVALVAVALATAVLAGFGATPVQAALGLGGFAVSLTEANGSATTLAGKHPYALDATIGFGAEDVKDIRLELPPGLIENPRVVAQCSLTEFGTPRSSPYETSRSGESCPDASQVGTLGVEAGGVKRYFGIFNLTPAPGRPAQVGAAPYGAPLVFTPNVRQEGGEYGVVLVAANVSQAVHVEGIELQLWGAPWAAGHNGQRGNCLNELAPGSPHAQCAIDPQTGSVRAYLTAPISCGAPLQFTLSANSWQQPDAFAGAGAQAPALSDCDALNFSFGASAVPSGVAASSPSGMTLRLTTSQAGFLDPLQRLSSQPQRAVVSLAEGVTINPSVGAGLTACTPAQYAAESAGSAPGEGCPNPSKIGAGTIETPLVEGALSGSLFIAKPFDNPFGSPYALYFVAKSPQRGFVVKIPGRLDADSRSGRLTATFEQLPQLPYTNLSLEFRQGQRAPLVTPPACGSYVNRVVLRPWANPGASLEQPTSFPILRGVGGGPCPAGGAPFGPKATTGTLSSIAGSASPFYLHLTRTDAEQEITSYSTTLPPGLLGAIAGIPFCPDGAIEAAKGRLGNDELAHPSCPAESEIGRTYSGYGVGLAPAYSPGRFYLAGPYRGAPLSVVAINPAIVGPFDLGTIVIRSAIRIDPRSAQVTIDSSVSDPIPHIFAGIPLRLRDVRVYIDRPGFMRAPTNCSPFSIVSALSGSDVPFDNPRSAFASAAVPYQASDCIGLGFAPKFALAVKGPARRGAYPQLRATVAPRPGDANIAAASVTLPRSIFLDQTHIRAVCTGVQAEADACPAGSVVGRARAVTPLLPEPMEGEVYLRSSRNPLPDLAATLRWRGLRVVLAGRIDSYHGGIRARFEGLPDAAVSQFQITLFGGPKRGLLVNAENLCRQPQTVIARFVGQSNLGQATKPRLGMRCGKGKNR
jgi:hypothetical protein